MEWPRWLHIGDSRVGRVDNLVTESDHVWIHSARAAKNAHDQSLNPTQSNDALPEHKVKPAPQDLPAGHIFPQLPRPLKNCPTNSIPSPWLKTQLNKSLDSTCQKKTHKICSGGATSNKPDDGAEHGWGDPETPILPHSDHSQVKITKV